MKAGFDPTLRLAAEQAHRRPGLPTRRARPATACVRDRQGGAAEAPWRNAANLRAGAAETASIVPMAAIRAFTAITRPLRPPVVAVRKP